MAEPPKVSVVTGANSGIGLEVVAGLRAAGHHVVMACRSEARCAAAKAELDARPGLNGSCECQRLDLGDYQSIRRFASSLGPPERAQDAAQPPPPRIHTLVNNAGVMGVEEHMRPNHFGPFLLTRLLLPLMAAGGRVVSVASEAHRRGGLQVERAPDGRLRLGHGRHSNWYLAYAQSKLANVLFTAELSRRLQQRRASVTAYSVSPGRVATSIFANVPGVLQPALKWLAAAAFQTPAQGARTVLHAALAPELQGRHELYLHACRPCAAAPAARDAGTAAALWELSCEEVGLSAAEDAELWPPH